MSKPPVTGIHNAQECLSRAVEAFEKKGYPFSCRVEKDFSSLYIDSDVICQVNGIRVLGMACFRCFKERVGDQLEYVLQEFLFSWCDNGFKEDIEYLAQFGIFPRPRPYPCNFAFWRPAFLTSHTTHQRNFCLSAKFELSTVLAPVNTTRQRTFGFLSCKKHLNCVCDTNPIS